MLAPIALFVYNRPEHTRRTVEALARNLLASESPLIIYSDAPKSEAQGEKVREVREYARRITGFKSVTVIERGSNLGLARSVIDGVSMTVENFGRVIVLEDDMVTSRFFLSFMNDALHLYEKEERVISIHGWTYPVTQTLPETFFLRGADCWGWATWKRGWDLFEPDGGTLLRKLKAAHLEKAFNFDGGFDYVGMLRAQTGGKNDSWAVRWYASAFLGDRLTLFPGRSLVQNIGIDDTGTHCGDSSIFDGGAHGDHSVRVGGIPVEESSIARQAIARFYLDHKLTLRARITAKLKSKIRKLLS